MKHYSLISDLGKTWLVFWYDNENKKTGYIQIPKW